MPPDLAALERLAAVAQVGGFRPPSTPRTSWLGQVLLGAPGEEWPWHAGRPMWGICQIRVDELPVAVPAPLDGFAVVTLFVDLIDLPYERPNGDGWQLRTYRSIEELVPLVEPEREPVPERRAHEEIILRPFPLLWRPRAELPSGDELPPDLYDAYEQLGDDEDPVELDGLKVGGWPRTIQSEVDWSLSGEGRISDAGFVLQVDSDEKAHLNWVDSGAVYIAWSPSHGWLMSCQFY